MKLVVERSGGFAGITRRGERDGSALTSEQRAALQKLLERSSDFPPDAGADRFNYRVEVQDDNGQANNSAGIGDASSPQRDRHRVETVPLTWNPAQVESSRAIRPRQARISLT